MKTLDYKFDDLPLVFSSFFESAFISGCASIRFDDKGEWSIFSIDIEGLSGGTYQSLALESWQTAYLSACDYLQTRHRDAIEEAVRAELENDGIVVIPSDYREHNTHNYASSGAR